MVLSSILDKEAIDMIRKDTKTSAKESNEGVIVAFDIDGTLIDYEGSPIADSIQLFHLLQRLGCNMVIWSAGGEAYARATAKWLGLSANVVKKGAITPDIAFDDNEFDLGKVNIRIPTQKKEDGKLKLAPKEDKEG